MVRWPSLLLLALGCRPADPVAAPTLTASCAVADDNALRAWCEVTTDPPGPVQVRFGLSGEEQVRTSVRDDATHRVGLYWMPADTTIEWIAERLDDPSVQATGMFTTGSLPPEAQESWVVDGDSSVGSFLHVGVCGAASMAVVTRASDGATLWYQRFPSAERFVGLERTEDDTILALSGPDGWSERSWMGEVLHTSTRPEDFAEVVHHDLTRSDGRTYVLFSDDVGEGDDLFRLDGFLVFEADGTQVARWSLADVWMPTVPSPLHGIDVVHANSIQVVDGLALVGSRHLSTVFAVAADPDAPDFGTIRWTLRGNEAQEGPAGDFVLVDGDGDPEDFEEQHHVTLDADGRLRMFDNRLEGASRGLVIEVDPERGEAVVVQSLPLDARCYYQGGHHRTAAGHAVLVCGPRREASEWSGDEVVWTATGTCASGASTALPRMVPLE